MAVPIDTYFENLNLNVGKQRDRMKHGKQHGKQSHDSDSWNRSCISQCRTIYPKIETSSKEIKDTTSWNLIEETKLKWIKFSSALQKLLDSEKQNRAQLDLLQERYVAKTY